jgi:hypothetical protein
MRSACKRAGRNLFGMLRGIAVVGVAAIVVSGCGGARMSVTPSVMTPLTVSVTGRECPASDAKPRLVLDSSAGSVLVPGHPTSALFCRYWGGGLGDVKGHVVESEHGHPARGFAGARLLVRQDLTSHLAGELDALGPIGPHPNCDEVLGGRSELIVFRYRRAGVARVLIVLSACVPVSNGRIVRAGLGMGDRDGETHWLDEALL